MQKQAPSIGRIVIAIGFALSCFGLLLFLWIAFGGPTPLKSSSYRFTVYFPEAHMLAQESDVRIGGVSVGKVKEISLADADKRFNGNDMTEAVIEIEPRFAPISSDARAMLRQKTLLGETYVELTSGSEPGAADEEAPVSLGAAARSSDAGVEALEALEEDGELGIGRVREQTQIDDIFNALDEETRTSFQRWQASAAHAIEDRGLDLNDAFGNLGPFLTDATDVVEILRRQEEALQGVIRDTGITFEALTERNQELAGAIVGSRNTFEALAREEEALAEAFRIFPTFQRESRTTFERLDDFQLNTRPLVRELTPVARELSPTLRDVRRLAPELRDLFPKLEELEHASEDGLPALRRFLDGLRPVLRSLDPFLANLNPVIRYLEFQKPTITDFLAGAAVTLSGTLEGLPGDPAPRHFGPTLAYLGAESLSIHPNRLPTNRGNAYKAPDAMNARRAVEGGIFPQFDCKNTNFSPVVGGEPDEQMIPAEQASPSLAPCFTEGDFPGSRFGDFGDGRFPQVFADP